MGVSLLKNLGVDETIIQALCKSYGEKLEGLQITKDEGDLKLLVPCSKGPDHSPHVVTIERFFEKQSSAQMPGPDVKSSTEQYRCLDKITFLSDDNSGKCNVKINGHEVRLGDSSLQLLRYLARELKRTGNGWVYLQDLVAEEIMPSGGYQPFDRLRSAIAGYLLNKNPKDLIESNGRKQYRISTDPGNVEILDEAMK